MRFDRSNARRLTSMTDYYITTWHDAKYHTEAEQRKDIESGAIIEEKDGIIKVYKRR